MKFAFLRKEMLTSPFNKTIKANFTLEEKLSHPGDLKGQEGA